MDKYEMHSKICGIMMEVYKKKNHDYGDSFGKGYKEYGMTMPLIRIEDKFNRFKQLLLNGNAKVKDESIQDTLLDMANYCVMTLIEMEMNK